MLIGSFSYNIDEKGRLFVPAKFREEMGESFVILMDGDSGCLAGYSPATWERVKANIENMPRDVRLGMRDIFRFAIEVTPDKQGRVTITPELRKLAGLDGKSEVVIIGAMNYIEIWSKTKLPAAGPFKIPTNIGL